MVMNPPAMWEIWVQSLGWEDLWRREKLPTPVFWKIPWAAEPGRYSSWGHKESDTTPFTFTCLKSGNVRTTLTKINFKWIKELTIRPNTVKLLE